MNIKVGQKVFVVLKYGNYKFEDIVNKVGKKYFYTSSRHDSKFNLETGEEEYSSKYGSHFQIYESKEIYDELQDRKQLAYNLSKLVSPKLKRNTLLAIQKLIEDDK